MAAVLAQQDVQEIIADLFRSVITTGQCNEIPLFRWRTNHVIRHFVSRNLEFPWAFEWYSTQLDSVTIVRCAIVCKMCAKFFEARSFSIGEQSHSALRRTERRARANWTLTIASLCRRRRSSAPRFLVSRDSGMRYTSNDAPRGITSIAARHAHACMCVYVRLMRG